MCDGADSFWSVRHCGVCSGHGHGGVLILIFELNILKFLMVACRGVGLLMWLEFLGCLVVDGVSLGFFFVISGIRLRA